MIAMNGRYPSVGMQSADMLQFLGVDGVLSSAIGAEMDSAAGDVGGVLQNLTDMFSKGVTGDVNQLFGQGLAPANYVMRPGQALAMGLARAGVGYNPYGGVTRESPFGQGPHGRSMEAAIKNDPLFKSMMERQLGGVIIPDGADDGKIAVYRPAGNQLGDIFRNMPNPMMGGIAQSLAAAPLALGTGGPLGSAMTRMAGNIAAFAVGGLALNGILGGNDMNSGSWSDQFRGDKQAEGFADSMGINLANATFEDVIFILLLKYTAKKEKEIMEKINQLSQDGKDGKGGKGGKGGLLGTVVGGVFGGPIGAMVGSSIGSTLGGGNKADILGMAGSAAGVALGGGLTGAMVGNAAGQLLGGAGQSGGGMFDANGNIGDPSKMSETAKQQALQKLMGDLQKLYEMLSNMIKSMHDMQMTPVRNLRG